MITYEFNKKNNFLEVTYTGTITYTDIVEFSNEYKTFKELSNSLLVLNDLCRAELLISQDEIKNISEFEEDNSNQHTYTRSAYLVDDPKTTALSMLYKLCNKKTNYECEVFSTKEAAINWLLKCREK